MHIYLCMHINIYAYTHMLCIYTYAYKLCVWVCVVGCVSCICGDGYVIFWLKFSMILSLSICFLYLFIYSLDFETRSYCIVLASKELIYRPDCPQTHKDSFVSTSGVLRLKMWASMPFTNLFSKYFFFTLKQII